MASPFTEAITQTLASNLDPMNGIVRRYAEAQLEQSDVTIVDSKMDTIMKLGKNLAQAKKDDMPISVIDALERLLQRASSAT